MSLRHRVFGGMRQTNKLLKIQYRTNKRTRCRVRNTDRAQGAIRSHQVNTVQYYSTGLGSHAGETSVNSAKDYRVTALYLCIIGHNYSTSDRLAKAASATLGKEDQPPEPMLDSMVLGFRDVDLRRDFFSRGSSTGTEYLRPWSGPKTYWRWIWRI